MKIAMLGHKRVPSREGGIEVVVEELSTRMASMGHEVILYNRSGHSVAGKENDDFRWKDSSYKGVQLKTVSTIHAKGLAAISAAYFATRQAMKDNPDVIHFHAEGPCLMLPMAKRAGFRTIATIHGLDWQRAKWGNFASNLIKEGEKRAARYADEIIVLSENNRQYFQDAYQRSTHFIPNGIMPVPILPASIIKEKYGLEKDDFILYVGRIVPEKGIDLLIDAFSKIETEKKLIITGGASDSGKYYAEMREMASKDDRVIFTGFLTGSELEELYSNALLYVLPSEIEGMPMSLLEAMAHGCCCLTSDIPECRTLTAETGLVFKVTDGVDLKRALESALNKPAELQRMGSASRTRTLARYNWDTVVAQTLKLYSI